MRRIQQTTKLSIALLCAAHILLCFGNVLAQKREGSLRGRILSEDGQPMAGVSIECFRMGQEGESRNSTSAASDEEGNFSITGLSRGIYSLMAFVPGYVFEPEFLEQNSFRPGDQALIRMRKGGVITGRVTDEYGDPIIAVQVRITNVRTLDGKTPQADQNIDRSWFLTDDRGIYRAYGLRSGVYVVSTQGGASGFFEGNKTNEMPTYAPSSTREGAAEITVHPGEEISGVDVRHRGERGRTISGWVRGEVESRGPFGGTIVMLNRIGQNGDSISDGIRPSHGFEMTGIPDGDYELIATRQLGPTDEDDPGARSQVRRISVRGADISGIELTLSRLANLSGRVAIEGGTCSPTPEAKSESSKSVSSEEIFLTVKRNQSQPSTMLLENDENLSEGSDAPNEKGEFRIRSLVPGQYRFDIDFPSSNLFLHSITQSQTAPARGAAQSKLAAASVGAINILLGKSVSGIHLRLAFGAADLAGKVVDGDKPVSTPVQVFLLPIDPATMPDPLRYYEAKTQTGGIFEFNNIAPGRYWLLAKPVLAGDKSHAIFWSAERRAAMRKEAEAQKHEIELKACQRVKDVHVKFFLPR